MSCDKLSKENNPTSPFQNAHLQSTDDILATINDQIPDYGGSYIDESGQLNILVTGKTQKSAQAQEALKTEITNALMEVERKYGGTTQTLAKAGRATLKEAQYSFKQLNEWKNELFIALVNNNIEFTGYIHDAKNYIVLELNVGTSKSAVTPILNELGISENAVVISGNWKPASDNTPISNKVESADCASLAIDSNMMECETGKIVHGVAISNKLGVRAGQHCSIGLNILLPNGQKGFLTASHCTSLIFGRDNDYFEHRGVQGSPRNYYDLNRYNIGQELLDPSPSSLPSYTQNGTFGAYCKQFTSPDIKCRVSDSALILYDSSQLLQNKLVFGSLPLLWGEGSHYISNPTYYTIVQGNTSYLQDYNINNEYQMIGATSGLVKGLRIVDSCANNYAQEYTEEEFIGQSRQVKVFSQCSVAVETNNTTIYPRGGDSGGPVFRVLDGLNGNKAEILGIMASRVVNQPGASRFLVSPIRNIFGNADKNQPLSCGPNSNLCTAYQQIGMPNHQFEFRAACARPGGDGCGNEPVPVTPTPVVTIPKPPDYGYRATIPAEILVNANYIRRSYATVWNSSVAMHYLVLTGEDRITATDGAVRSSNGQSPTALDSPSLVAKYYDAKCMGLGTQGMAIVECWDKRYISIYDVPWKVRQLLKAVDNSRIYSGMEKKYSLSLTHGINLWESSYIFKDPRTAPNYQYTLRPDNRLIIPGVNFPILIEKNSLEFLYAAYLAPKPIEPVCKDIINCKPPKPPVIIEEAKL